eukprot:scaffold6760_cov71-Cylindrotheca_fusiformis.AAC.1
MWHYRDLPGCRVKLFIQRVFWASIGILFQIEETRRVNDQYGNKNAHYASGAQCHDRIYSALAAEGANNQKRISRYRQSIMTTSAGDGALRLTSDQMRARLINSGRVTTRERRDYGRDKIRRARFSRREQFQTLAVDENRPPNPCSNLTFQEASSGLNVRVKCAQNVGLRIQTIQTSATWVVENRVLLEYDVHSHTALKLYTLLTAILINKFERQIISDNNRMNVSANPQRSCRLLPRFHF